MKKFNKAIQIEVEVDAIAQKMFETIKTDNPHAEMIAEAIIGAAMNNDSLLLIYNALNGFTNEIDFKVGQEVVCNETIYQYVKVESTDGSDRWEQKTVPMGNVVIKEIDIYRNSDKVQVEYNYTKRDGSISKELKWVSHRNLKAIEVEAQ